MFTVLPYYTPAAVRAFYRGYSIQSVQPGRSRRRYIWQPGNAYSGLSFLPYQEQMAGTRSPDCCQWPGNRGMLHFVYNFPLYLSVLSVTIGQIISCYGAGGILMLALDKPNNISFPSMAESKPYVVLGPVIMI